MTSHKHSEATFSLSEAEAYDAMLEFLTNYFRETSLEEVGLLLSELEWLEDGQTADPASWSDWLRAVQAVVSARNEIAQDTS